MATSSGGDGSLTRYGVAFGASGLLAYAASYVVSPFVLAKFLEDLGLTLIITAAVSLTVDRVTYQRLIGEVNFLRAEISQQVRTTHNRMRHDFEIVSAADGLGIEGLFSRSGPGRAQYEAAMKRALREAFATDAGEILVLCVAAPSFFRGDGPFFDLLWRKLHAPDGAVRLRVLVLDPRSQWTDLRAKLEPFHPTLEDIQTTVRAVNGLRASCGERVAFRTYHLPPIAFLVITGNVAFIEAYPMFPAEWNPDRNDGPIGGASPMLMVTKDSEAYRRWRAHFNYIWSQQAEDPDQPGERRRQPLS